MIRALLALLLCAAAMASGPRTRDADDALAAYLESRDLRPLLLDHLDAVLQRTPSEDRLPLAERLAGLLAENLESSKDPAEREALEQRARRLLDSVPDAESSDLRLNLHRLSYIRAETAAERRRLRLDAPQEADAAERSLRALAQDLPLIGIAAHKRVEALEKAEESSRDMDLEFVRESLAASRRRRSLAMYLAGWSGVYLAELTNKPEAAAESSRRFGWLLNAPAGEAPTIARVPEGSLKFEHVARAAMGVGVAASIRGDFLEATRWFDLVERAADAPAAVRGQIFARRLAAAARADEWPEALRLVRDARGGEGVSIDPAARAASGRADRPLPATDARLLAVLSFEARPPQRSEAIAARLRSIALADLVTRDELGQVLDLASRFGAEPLGSDGFIPLYVRALQAHERARKAHAALPGAPADAPTSDRDVIAQYASAQTLLLAAVQSADADKFPGARAEAAVLLASAVFYSSGGDPRRAIEAADRFAAAAKLASSPAAVADALWMAVRALDSAAGDGGKAANAEPAKAAADAARRREAAAAEFLRRYPDDPRSGTLLLKQSASGRLNPEQAVDALLRVSNDSPTYAASRREAARLLYARIRAAGEAQRPQAVARFVAVAEPSFKEDLRAATEQDPPDAEAAARAIVLARQLLDGWLGSAAASDAPRALGVLDAIAALDAVFGADLAPVRVELAFRRLQARAALGDDAQADAAAEALQDLAPSASAADKRFLTAGNRLMFRSAALAWHAGKSEPTARRVVNHGARLLADLATQAAGESADTLVSVQATVGDAASWLFANAGDQPSRELADRLLRAAVTAQPNNQTALRRLAEHAERTRDDQTALDCWKRLAAGAEAGSIAWFEARCRLLETLANTDPAAARASIAQHRALYPDFGPSPWGERIRALADRLLPGSSTEAPR